MLPLYCAPVAGAPAPPPPWFEADWALLHHGQASALAAVARSSATAIRTIENRFRDFIATSAFLIILGRSGGGCGRASSIPPRRLSKHTARSKTSTARCGDGGPSRASTLARV